MGSTSAFNELAEGWRRFRWSHPEWPLATIAVAAWLAALAVMAPADEGAGNAHHGELGLHNAGSHPGPALAVPVPMAHWALMVMAMMLPTILPAARSIAVQGIWARRQRAQTLFAVAYLAVWVAFGVTALAVWRCIAWAPPSRWTLAVALVVASVWQFTAWKLSALQICHRIRPIPPVGWRADRVCVQRGMRNGLACVCSCWAIMLPMLFAGHGNTVWLMFGLTLIVVVEKHARRPRFIVHRVAACLVCLAGVVTML